MNRRILVSLSICAGVLFGSASNIPTSQPSTAPTSVQIAEPQSSKQRKDARTVEELIEALSDPNPFTQKEAAEALTVRGSDAVEPLIALIRRPYSEQKEQLAKERAKEILCGNDPLAGNFFSPRQWAIAILGGLKDARAVEVLLDVLHDSHSYAQSDAAISLGYIGDVRAIESLVALMNDHKNLELARTATFALGNIGHSSIDALASVLRDRNSKLRTAALDALEGRTTRLRLPLC